MAGLAGGPVQDLCEEATCCICLDFFQDPVTIECGHNFCRGCLTHCWGESEQKASCPQCRLTLQRRNLIPNRPLANFVEITKKLRLQRPRGAEGMGRFCGEHQEPLKLFCKEEETPICVVCDRAKQHRNHLVVPIEEAAQEYKDQLCSCLENLRKDRNKCLAAKAETERESRDLLKEMEGKMGKAVSKFRQLHQLLEDQEKLLLAQMEEAEKEIIRKREEHLGRHSWEISFLGSLIQEMEEKCKQPASEFLQENSYEALEMARTDFRDIGRTLKKSEEREKIWSVQLVPPALKWKISETYDINPFLEDVMKKVKDLFLDRKMAEKVVENMGKLQTGSICIGTQPQTWGDVLLSGPSPQKVNVTLDPDTAFPRLILSGDLKSVRWDKKYQDLPEHPDRFNLSPFVLGLQEFSAGRYYWDISVRSEEQWAVGVASKSVKRKGPIKVSPECGIWAVGQSDLPLSLNGKLKKIRVFLSCAEGQVAFYNVDTEELLYMFSGASFSGQIILPFFRVFLGGHLRIV